MAQTARHSRFAALQASLARQSARPVLPLGLPAVDRVLPGGGLALGALHEVEMPVGDAAGLGFVLALSVLRQRLGRAVVLWCQPRAAEGEWGMLYGPGLHGIGLDPALLLLIRPANAVQALWAMEEGLRSGAVGVAVGAGLTADLVASRRLQLAAAEHGGLAFVLPPAGRDTPSAAMSRWRVVSCTAPGPDDAAPLAADRPGWYLLLRRCRGARLAQDNWRVVWQVDNSSFVPI